MTIIFLCPRCRAILGHRVAHDDQGVAACRICGSRFIPDPCDYCNGRPPGQRPCLEVEAFLRQWWSAFDIPNLPKHRAQLLDACELVTGEDRHTGTVLTGLFRSLAAAKGFVHFTSWGISHLMLGALKLLSEQDIWVNGIVSGAYPSVIQEVTKPTADESLMMNIVAFPPEASRYNPHQKLLVIDGLLAFKGSANLTATGWRKAAQQREMIEVVTDPAEIAKLHNIYFSKPWLQWGSNRFMGLDDEIKMQHM
ncbi:MAG: phospholipase D-like domain-containing protein [Actinobacteria bacterium]|nr:phospholipase D-like domain-containing protein [Actinomycetota bacterium]